MSTVEELRAASSEAAEWWSVTDAMTISASVLAFAFLTLCLVTYVMLRNKASSKAILKCFGLVLIVTMAAFLTVAGYDKDQLTAVIGLLGTLAGYLLGSETDPNGQQSPSKREE